MEKPTIENTNAVFQAGTTIGTYLSSAISEINKRLDDGDAWQHPQLIAECVRSQTMDYNNTALVAVLYEIKEALYAIAESNTQK